MAKPPSVPAVAIRLTATAEAYASRQDLAKSIASAMIGPEAAAGDVVSFEIGGERHDFMIVGRRWVAVADCFSLELTLDHPVRRGS